ncbi:hypothetical protein [Aureimonas sp. ME7]|uniref:hypothetical protein n=1 Tax=Aureimonas sp. ME7 TaxID=2744252 RepID=UPI001AEE2150|nr:hypothetical protein [Aureimonas sp. ME7]
MIDLYRRHNGPPEKLPAIAYTDEGWSRTDLANQPDSRRELGFVFFASYDPATQRVVEDGGTWQIEAIGGEPVTGQVFSVTMRQAKLALLGAKILDQADAAIAAMTGDDGRRAQIEWQSATVLRRDHPLVAGIGSALGLDEAAIDALFVAAAKIA